MCSSVVYAQNQKIGVVKDSTLKTSTTLYPILKANIVSLGEYLKDSVIEVEKQAMENYYKEVMERIGHGCGYSYTYELEAQEELQSRQDSLYKMAAIADEALNDYEDFLFSILDQELKTATAIIAEQESYNLIIITDNVHYIAADNLSPMIINQVNQQVANKNFQVLFKSKQQSIINRVKAKQFVRTMSPREWQDYLEEEYIFDRFLLMLYGTQLTLY